MDLDECDTRVASKLGQISWQLKDMNESPIEPSVCDQSQTGEKAGYMTHLHEK